MINNTEIINNITNNYKLILVLILIIIIIIIFKYYYSLNYKEYDDVTGDDKSSYRPGEIGVEHYNNLHPSNLNYKISNLDNMKFNTHKNYDLKKNNLIISQGNSLPLKSQKIKQQSNGPTVDGTRNTPKNMFMFALNKCDANCCPNVYSCSSGCVCKTDNQKKFLSTRGYNKSFANNGF